MYQSDRDYMEPCYGCGSYQEDCDCSYKRNGMLEWQSQGFHLEHSRTEIIEEQRMTERIARYSYLHGVSYLPSDN